MFCFKVLYFQYCCEATARCPFLAWPDTHFLQLLLPGMCAASLLLLSCPTMQNLGAPCVVHVLHFLCPHNTTVTAELSCSRKMPCMIPGEVQNKAD